MIAYSRILCFFSSVLQYSVFIQICIQLNIYVYKIFTKNFYAFSDCELKEGRAKLRNH